MPMDYSRYPENWKDISLAIRERAKWACEWCGAFNGHPHPRTGSKVILTVHHIGIDKPDGTPGDRNDKMDVRPEPKAISLDDLRAIFIACDESPEGLRDRALIAFLCDTGCRAGGALGLTVEDCDLAHLRARVVEKGDRPRVVPFSTFTAYHLIKWFEVRPKGTAVFCSLKKRRGLPLSYSGLAKILSRLKEKAGVKGRVNPHSFRHGFAREYVRNGGDLSSLSRLLGHSGIGVTADYYAVFSEPEIAEFHAKYSPIRNLINEHNRPDSP